MLVAYSDSDSDTNEPPRAKRRKVEAVSPKPPGRNASPPPPPASFHSLYATKVRTAAADDPSLHGGRTRQVAHVEGNWPTHVYLEWTPAKDELRRLALVIEHYRAKLNNEPTTKDHLHSLLWSGLNVQLPLHISLSSPLTLKSDEKVDFAAAVEREVSKCGARSFSVRPLAMHRVPNFDQTRSFLVLKLSRPENDDLNRLLKACNACADRFGLDLLYQPKKTHGVMKTSEASKTPADLSSAFHISIAWTLEKVPDLAQPDPEPTLLDALKDLSIHFGVLKLKIGNTVTDVKLPKEENA